MKRGNYKERKYTMQQIKDFERRLKEYKVSVRQLMKEERIGLKRLKKEFADAHVEFPIIPPGRKASVPTKEEIDAVIEYREKFNVGYQLCAFALDKKNIVSISARKCAEIYEMNDLFLYGHEYKEKDEERIRYVAKMVGQIWHTDLHEIDDLVIQDENGNEHRSKQYIVAFIDDRSRFIIHAAIVLNKESSTIAQELKRALTKTSAPARMIIDNGGEFTGRPFQDTLKKNGIKDWRTEPYTPQQNGKMERWWETFEKAKGTADLQTVVNEYNYAWRHNGLHEMTGAWITPSDMWFNEPHWSSGCPDEVEFSTKKISAK